MFITKKKLKEMIEEKCEEVRRELKSEIIEKCDMLTVKNPCDFYEEKVEKRLNRIDRILKYSVQGKITYDSYRGKSLKVDCVNERTGERLHSFIDEIPSHTMFYKDFQEYRVDDLYVPDGTDIVSINDDLIVSFIDYDSERSCEYIIDIANNKVVSVKRS